MKKVLSNILFILISLLAILGIIYVLYNQVPEKISSFNSDKTLFVIEDEENEYINNLYYQQLNDEEKLYYQCMYHYSKNLENTFEINDVIDIDEYKKTARAFSLDYPLYYWFEEAKIKTMTINNILNRPFNYSIVDSTTDIDSIKENNKLVKEVTSEIIEDIIAEDDYHTIKNIYDYVITSTIYDENYISIGNLTSALISKKAVCAGYAESFQFLANELGYECYSVAGKAKEDSTTLHEWNIIKIDDDWYWVDATWGDNNEENNDICYDPFLVDDEIFFVDHIPDNTFNYPACDNRSYYLYEHTGMFVKKYDETQIANTILDWLKQGIHNFYFKFTNKQDLQKMNDWFDSQSFSNLYYNHIGHASLSWSWSTNNDTYFLEFNWHKY